MQPGVVRDVTLCEGLEGETGSNGQRVVLTLDNVGIHHGGFGMSISDDYR